MMDFSPLPALDTLSGSERSQLYAWEREVVDKLAGNLFPGFAAFDPDDAQQSLVLLCWDIPVDMEGALERFHAKLRTASGNITQTKLSLLATGVLCGAEALGEAVRQLAEVREYYYLTACEAICYDTLPPMERQPLSLEELGNRLVPELRAKNTLQCAVLLDCAIETISGTPHRRADVLNACATLCSVASLVLPPMLPPEETGEYFTCSAAMLHAIRRFSTRRQVLLWMEEFKRQVVGLLENLLGGKADSAEKAKRYIHENVDKHIMLQDVANYVNLSPGYLSAMFKREYNQNLVDFINATKMERACALMREGSYRIYEISCILGFENAYYFTKVFKKHIGLTPTEYQRKAQKGADHV